MWNTSAVGTLTLGTFHLGHNFPLLPPARRCTRSPFGRFSRAVISEYKPVVEQLHWSGDSFENVLLCRNQLGIFMTGMLLVLMREHVLRHTKAWE